MDVAAPLLTLRNFGLVSAGSLLLAVLFVVKLNYSLRRVPEEAREVLSKRWSKEEIRETYERMKGQGGFDWKPHLPPKLNRRYVVIGGSGLVGGDLVHLLLLQGHSPDAIRIMDFRPPTRYDMSFAPASKADFVKTDIASPESLEKAFSKPWPRTVSGLPITVYHTAAVIRPYERHPVFYDRVSAVNVGGTRNAIEAASAAGVDIFVATSSASVAVKRASFWEGGLPWITNGKNTCQIYDESDFDSPMRPHDQFFGNYAVSKAVAERMVCSSNKEGFRTGCIRPANGVYGEQNDQIIGMTLTREKFPSWTGDWVQSFVASKNVGLGHMLYEAALAAKKMPKCAGRTYNISDPNGPPIFKDMYGCCEELGTTPVEVSYPPPALLFLLGYVVEVICVASARWPFLQRFGIREPEGDVYMLQPSVFHVSTHLVGLDDAAKKSVAEGGLGYRGGCTTIEGFCEEIWHWNKQHGAEGTEENGTAN